VKEHRWIFFLVIVVVALLLLYSVAFTVNFKQIGIVKTFGEAGVPINGATQAGLHWKWPWPIQSLVRYDRRTFVFEDTFEQVQTRDKQNFLVTVFCAWRIKDAGVFLRTIRTEAVVEDRLRDAVRDTKASIVGQHSLADFVNTDPAKMRISEIESEILQTVRPAALRDYGVEIVALGIRSLALPKSVTERVIENMKEERKREAELYRGRGQAVANAIRERARTAQNQILEFARLKGESIRAEGLLAAAEQYHRFKRNEQFAVFLRQLAAWREALKNNSVIVLDASVLRIVDFLQNGPSLGPPE
jgi:membrane protease subunit HflC